MTEKVPILLRLVPMLIVMATIFILSHQSGDQLEMPEIPYADKIAHFFVYGLLALSVLVIPPRKIRHNRAKLMVACAVLVAVAYGISDEYHQSFIPGREASPADIVADGFGALVFSLFWFWNCRYSKLRKRTN